jgi:hypothetical protein
MSRVPDEAGRESEPSYAAWKADALKALEWLRSPAARVTRDGFWTKLYVQGFRPAEAAELADREYRSSAPAALEEKAAVGR